MNEVYISANEIIKYLTNEGYEVKSCGNLEVIVDGFCSLNNPRSKSITWVKQYTDKVIDKFAGCKDCIVIAKEVFPLPFENVCFIIVSEPKEVFFRILDRFWSEQIEYRIDPSSSICTKKIAKNVSIGYNCYIGPEVSIGEGVIIEHNVTITNRVIIGANCIIHSGVVIGTDGFGYYIDENGRPGKVKHFGGVVIGDNVEIGANTCIDRGTIDNTVIGSDSKVDNLVHIAHNTQIGKNVMVIAGAIICGSAKVLDNAYIAPGGIVKNQLIVGENALVGMGAVVTHSIENDVVVAGIPAKELRKVQKNDK